MADIFESNLYNPSAPSEFMVSSTNKCRKLTFGSSLQLNQSGKIMPLRVWSFLNKFLQRLNARINPYHPLKEEEFHEKDVGRPKPCLKTEVKENLSLQKKFCWRSIRKVERNLNNHKTHLKKVRFDVNVQVSSNNNADPFERYSDKRTLVETDRRRTNSKMKFKKRNVKKFIKRKKILSKNLMATTKRVANNKRKEAQRKLTKSCQNWACGVANMTAYPPHGFYPQNHLISDHHKFDFSYISGDATRIFY